MQCWADGGLEAVRGQLAACVVPGPQPYKEGLDPWGPWEKAGCTGVSFGGMSFGGFYPAASGACPVGPLCPLHPAWVTRVSAGLVAAATEPGRLCFPSTVGLSQHLFNVK